LPHISKAMSATENKSSDSGRAYHISCTGDALITVEAHQKAEDITLFGSCFCPFVQRVWVAFEVLQIPYKYYEVDPYKKPKELLDVSPKGLVPGLRLNRYNPPRSLNESTVILDFLEDLAATTTKQGVLPLVTNPYARALARLQGDQINRALVPAFYRYLQAQDEEKQISAGKDFLDAFEGLVKLLERAEHEILSPQGSAGDGEAQMLAKGLGVWIPGQTDLGWADIMAGPWLYRASIVLPHYRGFELPQGERVRAWLKRLFEHPAFKATCSTEQLYLDSYERYAFNRPNTSMVATAINEGRALP
jgi:glutathione S-transferase